MRVLVLTSPEGTADRPDTADTFVQAAEIAACLRALGHDARVAPCPSVRNLGRILDNAPDLVFNLVEDLPEGPAELPAVTQALDRRGVPYTGAGTAALRLLADKRAMKTRLAAAGLPVAPALGEAGEGARYIVKSAVEHASLGIGAESVVHGTAAARRLIARRQAEFGGAWFAEAYIDGREFNVSVLAGEVLPLAEIRFADHPGDVPKILGYAEKWQTASHDYAATPRVFPPAEEPLFAALERLSRGAWDAFGLAGYARVDFRVDPAGAPYILELNANPCLAADAGFCAAAAQDGLTQATVVARLLEAARAAHPLPACA
jgi:D-alanine-D-alanine ligase